MSRLQKWFLRRLLKKLLGRQSLRQAMIVIAKESKDYYNESNQPTVEAHLHDLLDIGIQCAYQPKE